MDGAVRCKSGIGRSHPRIIREGIPPVSSQGFDHMGGIHTFYGLNTSLIHHFETSSTLGVLPFRELACNVFFAGNINTG